MWATPVPKYAQSLQKLLDAYHKSPDGRSKIMFMATIQKYLDNQSLSILENEINALTDVKDINVLLGSGCRGYVHLAVMAKKIGLMATLPLQPQTFANLTQ